MRASSRQLPRRASLGGALGTLSTGRAVEPAPAPPAPASNTPPPQGARADSRRNPLQNGPARGRQARGQAAVPRLSPQRRSRRPRRADPAIPAARPQSGASLRTQRRTARGSRAGGQPGADQGRRPSTSHAAPRSAPTPCRASPARSSATSATPAGRCAPHANSKSSPCTSRDQRRASAATGTPHRGADRRAGRRRASRRARGARGLPRAARRFARPPSTRRRRGRRSSSTRSAPTTPSSAAPSIAWRSTRCSTRSTNASSTIVRLYYQHELTQSEIGGRLGYSQMHISRLLRRRSRGSRASPSAKRCRRPRPRPRTHGRWSHCRRASATWPSGGAPCTWSTLRAHEHPPVTLELDTILEAPLGICTKGLPDTLADVPLGRIGELGLSLWRRPAAAGADPARRPPAAQRRADGASATSTASRSRRTARRRWRRSCSPTSWPPALGHHRRDPRPGAGDGALRRQRILIANEVLEPRAIRGWASSRATRAGRCASSTRSRASRCSTASCARPVPRAPSTVLWRSGSRSAAAACARAPRRWRRGPRPRRHGGAGRRVECFEGVARIRRAARDAARRRRQWRRPRRARSAESAARRRRSCYRRRQRLLRPRLAGSRATRRRRTAQRAATSPMTTASTRRPRRSPVAARERPLLAALELWATCSRARSPGARSSARAGATRPTTPGCRPSCARTGGEPVPARPAPRSPSSTTSTRSSSRRAGARARVGDLVCLGISHPCGAFDRWRTSSKSTRLTPSPAPSARSSDSPSKLPLLTRWSAAASLTPAPSPLYGRVWEGFNKTRRETMERIATAAANALLVSGSGQRLRWHRRRRLLQQWRARRQGREARPPTSPCGSASPRASSASSSTPSRVREGEPQVKVKVVGGINDDKIIAASRGGKSPDVAQSFSADNAGAFCGSGAWLDLKPYMDRDGISDSIFPPAPRSYTQFDGTRCSLPMLADAYGLYYNEDMLKKAGLERPAEDGLRARRLREEADRQEPRRVAEGRRVQPGHGLVLEHAGQLRPDVRRQVGRRRRQVDARQRPRVGEAPQLAEAADRLVRIQQSRQVPGRSRG